MKKAKVFVGNIHAGEIAETDFGYEFHYLPEYIQRKNAMPVSLTLPLRKTPYRSNILFPFFDGLIPEGWLLDIAQQSWKISARDRFSLLLACCKDCIGNVSVSPIDYENQHE